MLNFIYKIKQSIYRYICKQLLRVVHRPIVSGYENYTQFKGKKLLLVANHSSLLDGVILRLFIGDVIFIVSRKHYTIGFHYFFLKHSRSLPVDLMSPFTVKAVISKLKNNEHCFIFPEGKITKTGTIMKIEEGTAMIASLANAPILPIHVQGADKTHYSYVKNIKKPRVFQPLEIRIGKPFTLKKYTGKSSRTLASLDIYDKLLELAVHTRHKPQTLFQTLLTASRDFSYQKYIIEDESEQRLSYKKIVLASLILGKKFYNITKNEQFIGLMLPNVAGIAVSFFALQAFNFTPVMINFTMQKEYILHASELTKVKYIITSRLFIEKAKLSETVEFLSQNIQFIYLEDVRASITYADKVRGLFQFRSPSIFYRKKNISADSPAVVLFSSGTEALPKAVSLSHNNILSNIVQFNTVIDLNEKDIIMNVLPLFHAFGLTVGFLAPLFCGIKTFFYTNPLHYNIIPKLCYDMGATIICGTDIFLKNYGKNAHPMDFHSIRYAISGAEKMSSITRHMWMEKFGIRILEGYGTTETSPVLSVNTPLHHKINSVGRLLPCIEHKLVDIEENISYKKLVVKGPNIMMGYFDTQKTGKIIPQEEWYDTGDIVEIDEEGFIFIVDRYKRFFKSAGESISLGAIESILQQKYHSEKIAVVAISDQHKGEIPVIITEIKELQLTEIKNYLLDEKTHNTMIPRKIFYIEKILTFASGKKDYYSMIKYIHSHS